MARNKTEICNLAVSWLGGQRITSVDDDDSQEANLCRANYDMARMAVLEERDWTFAMKRKELTPLVSRPDFGYSYKFQVPQDCLRVTAVYSPSNSNISQPEIINYVVEGSQILCNIAIIHVKYIEDVTNTTLFSPQFDQALASYLATNIAVGLTESVDMQQRMAVGYIVKLDSAAAADGRQGTREMLNRSELEGVRRLHVRPR